MDGKLTPKSGSKQNLNEVLPLLKSELSEKEKDKLELRERVSTGSAEKDDSATERPEKEKQEADMDKNDTNPSKDQGRYHRMTQYLKRPSLPSFDIAPGNKNKAHLNCEVNIPFEELIAEPDATQTYTPIWNVIYLVFTWSKLVVYRTLTAIVGLPIALFWGLFFSLFTLVYVWGIKPVLRLFTLSLHPVRQVWSDIINTFLTPVMESFSRVLSGISISQQTIHV